MVFAPPAARALAALIAVIALSSLGVRVWVEAAELGSVTAAIWSMARFFTILTNTLVAVLYGWVALSGRLASPAWFTASTVWILVVGAIYHLLLAADHNPVGVDALSNEGLHTLVPLAVLAFWALYAPKHPIHPAAPVLWAGYPLAYAVYAIGRGQIDGVYPYFFLNPVTSGVPTVAAYVLGLGALFLVLGYLGYGAARLTLKRAA